MICNRLLSMHLIWIKILLFLYHLLFVTPYNINLFYSSLGTIFIIDDGVLLNIDISLENSSIVTFFAAIGTQPA